VVSPIWRACSIIACAFSASFCSGPTPPSGFCIRSEAMPQYAIAQLRSLASTLRKTCSPAPNQNECSMATPRARSACTAGAHELEKFTLPTWPCPVWPSCSSWQSAAAVVNRSAATLAMAERSFIMNSPRLTNEFRVRNNTCYRGGCGRAGIFFSADRPTNGPGPPWVKRVGLTVGQPLPVYPEQRTSSDWPDWSVSCHGDIIGS
jgi:hypothetical protein